MSRIGRQPIPVPSGVEVKVQPGHTLVKGPKGEVDVPLHPLTAVREENGFLLVSVDRPEERQSNALWGLTRALLANAVQGVTSGFEKRLVVVGTGYRADLKGKNLEMQVGFSHSVSVPPPPGIEFSLEGAPSGIEGAQATVVVRGVDKQLVGRVAADVRKVRKPEPYKGKGIRYADEYVRRKAGKAAMA